MAEIDGLRKATLAGASVARVCRAGWAAWPGFHAAELESVSGTFQSGTYECKPHFPMKEKQKTNPENGGIIRF